MTLHNEHDTEFGKKMRELRCTDCKALLAKEYVYRGRIAIKCWRCKMLNRFIFKDWRNKPNANI